MILEVQLGMMLRSSLDVLEFYFIQLNIMSHLSIECSTQWKLMLPLKAGEVKSLSRKCESIHQQSLLDLKHPITELTQLSEVFFKVAVLLCLKNMKVVF